MSETSQAAGQTMAGKFGLVLLGAGATALVWVIFAGGGQEQPLATEAKASADQEKAIRKVLQDQDSAWNNGDLEGFMAGYLHSPRLAFLSGNEIKHGWDETLKRYRDEYQGKGKEMGRLSFKNLDIHMLRPDLALVTGHWQLVRKKDRPDGLFTLLMQQTPEGWRIIHDHTSAARPPAKKTEDDR
jgi:beta-aspartyl-peptidase (threonine type)